MFEQETIAAIATSSKNGSISVIFHCKPYFL